MFHVCFSMTVSVWSTILFIAWPQEEPQLACAGRRWWGLQLSLLTRRASVYEEKTRGFDVKLREHPVSILSLAPSLVLSLPLSLKVRVYITPSIQLTVKKNKPKQFITLSHYISPPAWLGWVRVYAWNILQVFFSETQHNGLTVSCSKMCRPWTAWRSDCWQHVIQFKVVFLKIQLMSRTLKNGNVLKCHWVIKVL